MGRRDEGNAGGAGGSFFSPFLFSLSYFRYTSVYFFARVVSNIITYNTKKKKKTYDVRDCISPLKRNITPDASAIISRRAVKRLVVVKQKRFTNDGGIYVARICTRTETLFLLAKESTARRIIHAWKGRGGERQGNIARC